MAKLSEAQLQMLRELADGAQITCDPWGWCDLSTQVGGFFNPPTRVRRPTVQALQKRRYVIPISRMFAGCEFTDYLLADAGRAALQEADDGDSVP